MNKHEVSLVELSDAELTDVAGGAGNGLLGLLGLDAININLLGSQTVQTTNQNRGGLLGGLLLPGLL